MYTLNNAKFHKLQEPSGEHFSLPGHTFHQLQGLAIEQVKNKDPFKLKAREAWLTKKVRADSAPPRTQATSRCPAL